MADIGNQALKPTTFIFGTKYLNWGVTEKDRDINRRLTTFKNWGLNYIKKKIQEIKDKIKN